MSADTNLGAAANAVTLNGGTLVTTATFSSARNVTLGGGTLSPNSGTTLTLSGVLSGSAGLTLNGQGTLALSGTNTFTGGVTVTAGTLSVSADANFGAAANAVTLSSPFSTLKSTATFSSARNVTEGGAVIAPNAGTTLTLSGVVSGSAMLILNGAGTLVLSGANTYTGGTVIEAGTLSVSADNNLGNASRSVTLEGATLATTATFTSARGVTLFGGGISAPSGGTTLTLSGPWAGQRRADA